MNGLENMILHVLNRLDRVEKKIDALTKQMAEPRYHSAADYERRASPRRAARVAGKPRGRAR